MCPVDCGDTAAAAARAREPRERRMASSVPSLRSERDERAAMGGRPSGDPLWGVGGPREARPSKLRRTGEPSPARLRRSRPGRTVTVSR
jgi:hypothetical protein